MTPLTLKTSVNENNPSYFNLSIYMLRDFITGVATSILANS